MARAPEAPPVPAGPSAGGRVVPLTVIAGYHGAGKTTLLEHLFHNSPAERIAVLVNDFDRVSGGAAGVRAQTDNTVTLANGSVCWRCEGPPDDALVEARPHVGEVERVLVEVGGEAGPPDITAYRDLPGYRLDSVIVVTDAEAIRSQAHDPGTGGGPMAQLLSGDLVVLNKADLVSRRELDAVADWLKELIPNTRVVESSFGRLPPALLLEHHPAGPARRERRPAGPRRAIERHPHEVGYTTWSWLGDEPIDEAGFRWWAATLPEGVIRARGILHLRTDPATRFVFDLIGTHWTIRREGPWGDERPATTLALLGRAGSVRPDWLEMTIRRCTAPAKASPRSAAG
jgi:G3E family GTPase